MRTYLRAFFVGSSFPVLIWPFLYLGLSFTFNPTAPFAMGIVPITLPIVLGIANMIYVFTEEKWSSDFGNKRLWIFGAVYGLLLSLYANFVSNLPRDLFLLTGPVQYLTIPFAIVVYSLIWRFIIKYLNKVVGISSSL